MVKKKGKSKRVTLKDKYKMQRRVVETHRKTRKQAKRDSKAGIVKHDKTKKDPGIPNSWPFKQELLQSIKQGREKDEARKLEEKERRKNGGDLAELMASADRKRSDFDARQQGLAGTATATTAVVVGGDEHAPSHGQSSRRAYLRSLKQVIESSDVILQVLDARDPLGTRVHPAVEAGILSHPDKRMVLVLNKIDLIPKANVADWLTHLRRSHPTVALKAGTARSGRSNESGRSSGIGRSEGEGALDTTMAVGVEGLLQLLKNYARRGGDGKRKSKTCIAVGIIGYPNVGKSSILNSLKRSRAVGVSPTPGFTKSLQEVVLDGSIRLIDSPGVVFDDGDSGAGAVLRNSVDPDSVRDPMPAMQSLLGRCNPESLMMTYGVPAFPSGPDGVMTFLAMVARSKGRVLQGGVPDKVMAARLVIKDWNRGKIPYYSVPPPTGGGAADATTTTSAAIDGGAVVVSEFADEFDVNKILEAHDKELMAGLDDVDEMDFVRMDSIVPGTTTSDVAGGGEILDYLTGNRREGEEGGDDDDDDSGSDDMDDEDEDGAAANAKMEEAEDYDFGQE